MTNPTPQPASEPEEWRAEQRADGWWTLLTNSTILAFGMDTATKDTILADHAQAMTADYANALEAVAEAARMKICPQCDDCGFISGPDFDYDCPTCHGLDREERIDAALQALDSLRGQES